MAHLKQTSLFDDAPTTGTSVGEVLSRSKPMDKAQATFRRLVSKIERQREALQSWHSYTVRYSQRVASELIPLQQEFRQLRRQMVFLLDELYDQPKHLKGKVQRARLREMLIGLAQDLLQEEPDAELEALHDKHSDMTHAEGIEEDMALSQALIQDVFGVDLGGHHGAKSMDELLTQAAKAMREQTENARREDIRPRRKSRKAEAAQAKREQAAKEVSQSVREVYRKLASSLHPDRETDPDLRKLKTEQMQRVNQAYEAGDLLELLNLQLEIEQIDASHLTSIPQQRLTHYNQVLREQSSELDSEIQAVVMPFRMAMQLHPFTALTPEIVDRSLSAEIARVRIDIRNVKADLVGFRDPAVLKQALHKYHFASDGPDALASLALLDNFRPSVKKQRAKQRK